MNVEPYNFVVVRLCDRDFPIKDAVVEGVDCWGLDTKACPIVWKQFIVAYLIGYNRKRAAIDGRTENEDQIKLTESYLEKKIRVTFEKNPPTEDHDGGSVAYDVNTKYAWTF
jgi:hypothetical protein